MAKTNTYDVARDRVIATPQVVWVDRVTGSKKKGPAEGVSGFAVCVRRMDQEDGTQGEPRISMNTCYVAQRASKRQVWILGEKGRPELGNPEEGSLVLGSALKRLSPDTAATVLPLFAKYAAKAAQALDA